MAEKVAGVFAGFPNDAAEFIYYRTYSRWFDELGRRETWPETVDRTLTFLKEERPQVPDKVFKKIKEYMLSLEVMPSMRLVWTAGKAARSENISLYNCSFLVIDRLLAFAEMVYLLMNGTGVGFSVQKQYIDCLPAIKSNTFRKIELVTEDSRKGWAESILFLLENEFEGIEVKFDYSLLRKKGSVLKTFGGRSAGPEPLIIAHSFIQEVIHNARGRKLTSLECHDIACQIAECVVSGGVRRSSLISLFDFDDELMLSAKDGNNWPKRRMMANNSLVCEKKPTAAEFLRIWASLASSGTGEPGLFNLEQARLRSPDRRDSQRIAGTNPCVSGNTELLTETGYKRIDSLVGKRVNIWNGFEWTTVEPRVTGENQELLKVEFSNGTELLCTPSHVFHVIFDYSGCTVKLEAKDLKPKMRLMKHSFPVIVEGEFLNFAYTNGFVAAEGVEQNNHLSVYLPKKCCLERLGGVRSARWNEGAQRYNVILDFIPVSKAFVPLNCDLASKLQWLAGLLDRDGTELKEGGSQLCSINEEFILNVQKLLGTLGVASKVNKSHNSGLKMMPDGRGGKNEYLCQDVYRICIGAVQVQHLKSIGLRCERLKFNKNPQRDASRFVRVINVSSAGIADKVYCLTDEKRHLGLFNQVVTGQCGETLLRDHGLCNLSSVVLRPDDDLDDVFDKIETATWLGVIQSTFTEFNWVRDEWKTNCEEERLMGLSLSGQLDAFPLITPDNLKAMRKKAIKIARKASKHLGINMPVAITCVKPEGSSSQLVDSSSGMHPRYDKYYIRRYRISAHDPLCKMLKDQGFILSPEVGQEEPNVMTYVVEFPIKSPDNSIVRSDISALRQLEHYRIIQENWCEMNASMTIYVKENEWFEVGNWVYHNWEIVNGLSFFPYDGGKYQLAPLESITEDQYNEMISKHPKIDYSQLYKYESEDYTIGSRSYACVSGACEL